jgi:TPR repeat protein
MYLQKYLKYKNKYLELVNQKGGLECQDTLVFTNTIGSCWMVAIQTILVFGDFTRNNLEKTLKSIQVNKICDIKELEINKKCFIEKQIKNVKNNSFLNNTLPAFIFNDEKIENLKLLLDKFIDRYYSKIFSIRNIDQPIIDSEDYLKGRCELLINKYFKDLYLTYNTFSISDVVGGNLIEEYLFINTLSIFLLNFEVSFTNYNKNNFKDIDFNVSNFIGIIIEIEQHACCFFYCNKQPKYYNDNDKITYNCDFEKIIKNSKGNLYVKEDSCIISLNEDEYNCYPDNYKLKDIKNLTVITKYTNSDLDKELKIIINKEKDNYKIIKDNNLLHYIGILISKVSQKEANYFFKKAALNYDSDSQSTLGEYYYKKNKISKAYCLFTQAAKNNSVKAKYYLGEIYYDQNDYIKSIFWFTKVIQQDTIEINKKIKTLYKLGLNNFKLNNFKKAIEWFNIAAIKYNNPDSQYMLGYMYYNNKDIYDINKVIIFLTKAARNNKEAQLLLGQLYEKGKEVEENIDEAINYYEKAAYNNNSVDAQYNLGKIHQNFKNYPQAIKFYKMAEKQGNLDALNNLGFIYEHSPENYDINEAFENYTKAANLGNNNAQYNLGKYYLNKKYDNYNECKAIEWLLLAATNGSIESQYTLGIYYKNKNNITLANKWFKNAAKNGNVDAQYILGIYYTNKNEHDKAFKWLEKAAKQNNIEAQFMIANMYYEGEGIDQSDSNAIYWYQKASDQGHHEANTFLEQLQYKSRN